MTSCLVDISVGARASCLSRAQVDEVYQEIARHFSHIRFHPIWVITKGDRDKTTSLKTLEKTNFFTDEIDMRQLKGEFRISIHSAKDLPDPLHPDLEIVAFTKGMDPSDSLVVREFPIQFGSRIGTSSHRREAFLKNWRHDLECIDIRGTIDERLKLLDDRVVDGVVVAEAALIRLKLTDRPRLHLDIDTAQMQGRLAVIARKNDHEIRQLFEKIHR
ncbi:MAG: hydroxymethylbilane synthase [Rhabdochlamydiaceae bacterium]